MYTVFRGKKLHVSLLMSFFTVFIWSVIKPQDYGVWFAEVFPVMVGLILVLTTYNRFRLTNLVYILIWLDAVVILIGGHYTYSEMPLFDWLQTHFHLARNYYDRFGHFFQGVLPAILAREVYLRKTALHPGKYLLLIAVSTSLAASAAYELIEWIIAGAAGYSAKAFLGNQGDVWDTQWDMFMALCGAILSLLTLGRMHDKQLEDISDV